MKSMLLYLVVKFTYIQSSFRRTVEEAGVFLTYTLTDHGGRSKVKLLISLQSNFDLGYSNQWTKNRAKELEMKVCIPN